MCDNKFDPRFYPEVYQAVAGKDYTVYAYMNDGSVRKFDVKPLIKKGGVFRKIEDKEIFKKVQELRENNARSQNRIREFEAPAEMELKDYRLGKVEEKHSNPYKQAEYAYSKIEEYDNE